MDMEDYTDGHGALHSWTWGTTGFKHKLVFEVVTKAGLTVT